jgi:DNA polymerase sigma
MVPIAVSNIKILWKHYKDPKKLLTAQAGTIKFHTIMLLLLVISIVIDIFL